jgi:hypothetical protein
MCLYANAFIPDKTSESLNLPDFPFGLFASTDHEVNLGFQNQFKGVEGTFLTFHDGHCLCQFQDWEQLLDFVNQIRQANGLDSIPLMVFWSSAEYENITFADVDLELDRIVEKPKEGSILRAGVSIIRRLVKYVGNEIKILFKSGKVVTGILEEYKETEDLGLIRTRTDKIYFNSRELKEAQINPEVLT